MELVVLSGKGGTGKTTIAISLSKLVGDVVRVDCDVDAPNFYMFYDGENIEEDVFTGKKACIDEEKCIKCGVCESVCRFDAIKDCKIDSFSCESCGACALACPQNAITLEDEKTADTFITKLDKGILSRAEMEVGSDGSGKLISVLRKKARQFNKEDKFIISDGSPGIGCSVISSITGCDSVLVVTEPTKSGLQDLQRVVDLCEHFGIFTMVCINKFDINNDMAEKIEKYIKDKKINLVGKIPYDDTVMKSVNELKPIIEYKDSKAGQAIISMYKNIKKYINI